MKGSEGIYIRDRQSHTLGSGKEVPFGKKSLERRCWEPRDMPSKDFRCIGACEDGDMASCALGKARHIQVGPCGNTHPFEWEGARSFWMDISEKSGTGSHGFQKTLWRDSHAIYEDHYERGAHIAFHGFPRRPLIMGSHPTGEAHPEPEFAKASPLSMVLDLRECGFIPPAPVSVLRPQP